jgi:amino-acid N-acetyltransferase
MSKYDNFNDKKVSTMTTTNYIQWFRSAAPYINAFRKKTFVIVLSGEIVKSDLFDNLIHDIALCHHLGIKLVLVHGSRFQIDQLLNQHQIEQKLHNNIRISEVKNMPLILQAIDQVKNTILARLSMGLPNTPMSGSDISIVSGNFVTGMPLGIIDGVDMQHSGKVRSVDTHSISNLLDQHIVLLSNVGYSKSGEIFNLQAEELGEKVATALSAEKLIYFNQDYISNPVSDQFSTDECISFINEETTSDSLKALLHHAISAVKHSVNRVHIIDENLDGGLLQELFTRDGAGMMVTNLFYEGLRKASIEDIGGILELIQPLEQAGTLIKRSREQLELEIDAFQVIERDGMVIACIACIADLENKIAEVACVAVHPDYRKCGYGDQLLSAVELTARKLKLNHLYILTTRTMHWFLEKGFVENTLQFLPDYKARSYNQQRKSRIMTKALG